MADHESNNLIDWSGPGIECTNKPLIPLPSLNSPFGVGEDNPFDAVERQIIENELLDIFSMNLSFNEDNDDIECRVVSNSAEEVTVDWVDEVFNYGGKKSPFDEDTSKTSPKESENDISFVDTSFINSHSSLSDFKEVVQNRISCLNQALNANLQLKSFSVHSSVECGKSACLSETSKLSNDCFIQQDSEVLKNFGTECEDLQSIKLDWDQYFMSSSDEENEKPIFLEKSKLFKQVKKTPSKQVLLKIKDVRAPLLCQDPNIRIKKVDMTSKRGPLKAVVPIPNMKKLEDRKSTGFIAHAVTSSKSKVTSSNLCKPRKWYSPMAASTPQNSKTYSPNFSKSSLTSNSSFNSSIQKQNTSTMSSLPPSPDSTSDSTVFPRIISAVRITPKTNLKNISSNIVSSSTRITDQSRTPLKTPKDVGTRSLLKNVRNKENLKPFRY